MTKTINNIVAEFDTLIPGIKADTIAFFNRRWNYLVKLAEGEPSYRAFRKITRNAWSSDAQAVRSMYSFMHTEDRRGFEDAPLVLDVERVEKFAQQHAEDQVAAFTSKLIRKLGDLTDVELVDINLNSFEFTIVGKLNGVHVRVHQQVVFKMSSKGNHFCQWPARIYVDGKFHSEAAFKKLAA